MAGSGPSLNFSNGWKAAIHSGRLNEASAPKAAARREFNLRESGLNVSSLNIGRPLFDRPCQPRRQFGASFTRSLPIKGFGTFASDQQNGFVAVMNCFMTVS